MATWKSDETIARGKHGTYWAIQRLSPQSPDAIRSVPTIVLYLLPT